MKKEISPILSQKGRTWIPLAGEGSKSPPYDVPVAIRMVDRNQVAVEDETGITYIEDIKVAKLTATATGSQWVIQGPFPMFDYSPLSYYNVLKANVIVTHWAECTEGQLEYWKHRFDVRGDWDHLELKVDTKHREIVYRALMHGSIYLRYAVANEENEAKAADLHNLLMALYDLQSVMDIGGTYDKKFEKKLEETKQ